MKKNDILREWADIMAIRAVAAAYALKARAKEKRLRDKVGGGSRAAFQCYIDTLICQKK